MRTSTLYSRQREHAAVLAKFRRQFHQQKELVKTVAAGFPGGVGGEKGEGWGGGGGGGGLPYFFSQLDNSRGGKKMYTDLCKKEKKEIHDNNL